MKEWFTPAEIAALALPSMPATLRGINMIAKREGWLERRNASGASLSRRREGRGGGWEYHYSLFPTLAQTRLVAESVTAQRKAASVGEPKGRGEMWDWFERQPETRKQKARDRLAILEAVAALQRGGLQKDVAVHEVARANGVGKSAIYSWADLVAGVDRADWLPYLAPRFAGRTAKVDCSEEAWQAIKADYLRQSQPSVFDLATNGCSSPRNSMAGWYRASELLRGGCSATFRCRCSPSFGKGRMRSSACIRAKSAIARCSMHWRR